MLSILIQSLSRKLGGAFARLLNKEITASQWFDISARLIARYHLAALMAGLGRPKLTQNDLLVSWELISGQLQYLDAFRLQIQEAAEFQTGWESRAKSYAEAIKVPYWSGKTKMLPLPAMPAQGTQCMNNCGCEWDVIPVDAEAGDYDAYWRRGKEDSCQTCIEREKQWNPVYIRGGQLVSTKAFTLKHLAGEHDQKTHAGVGAGGDINAQYRAKAESVWGQSYAKYHSEQEYLENIAERPEYQNWKDNLSSDQAYAIKRYTEQAFDSYNSALRRDEVDYSINETSIKSMQEGLKKGELAENTMLYRGFTSKRIAGQLESGELAVGKVFVDKGFMSTSTDPTIALDFSDTLTTRPRFVLNIKAPKGTKGGFMIEGLGIGGGTNESEFVFPHGTPMYIHGIRIVDNITYLDLLPMTALAEK